MKLCPNCGNECSDEQITCDCGWNFEQGDFLVEDGEETLIYPPLTEDDDSADIPF